MSRGSWRVPLRMARRTARREPGRALMVVLLIALPVAAVAGSVITGATNSVVPLRAAQVALGSADGSMYWTGVSAPGINLLGQTAPNDGTTPEGANLGDEPQSPVAALPTGSRALQIRYADGGVRYDGQPYGHVSLIEEDLSDALLRGAYSVVSGRLPAAAGEVVVSDELSARIDLAATTAIAVTHPTTSSGRPIADQLRVVGIVHDNAHRRVNGTLIGPAGGLGLSSDVDSTRSYLLSVPGGISWRSVLQLSQHGWATTSRQVLAAPPSGCTSQDDYCDARGPIASPRASSIDSSTATVIALATVMALLQIVLLVGPAFAVGLRRRRRDLGLLGVSGARPAQLRRVVLAEGVVLGLVGAVAGLALAWVAVYALRGILERGGHDHWLGLPVLNPMILVVAAFGLATAIVAAAQPARQAARTDAASAVGRGSLHLGSHEGSRRVRVLGAGAVVLGTAIVLGVGIARAGGGGFRSTTSAIPLLLGCITAELGVVALTPTIIALVARLADRLQLSPRLALRDAARNRLRSGAAVAAVTAAMAGSVAALLYSTSTAAAADRAYKPYAPLGSMIVQIGGPEDPGVNEGVRDALAKALPLKGVWSAPILDVGVGGPDGGMSAVQVVPPASGRCPAVPLDAQGSPEPPANAEAPADPRCGDMRETGEPVLGGAPVGNGDLLAAITGVDDPQARQVLAAGGAVVFSRYLAEGGTATIEVNSISNPEQPVFTRLRTLTTPVYVLEHGFAPGTMFLSPQLAARIGVAPVQSVVYGTLAHKVSGGQIDHANAVASRILGSDNESPVSIEQGRSPTSTDLLLAAVVAVAAFLAVAAAITAGGLALADSRSDLATLAAVGAPPRLRRRLAASQAGVLTLIGCVLGVGAGFLPGWSMVHTTEDYSSGVVLPTPLVVPWTWIGSLTVGLPVLTALAVGLAVRSRIVLGRRSD